MAGAGYKTFTAGEVLTASDVNTYLMQQTVQNYGGTAARSSAIPSPSTGMVSYIGDDGNGISQIQAYNGSSWNNMGGLVLIKTQTIGTGVSSVTVTNAFSSTYDSYKIVVTGGASSAASEYMAMKMGTTATGYYDKMIYGAFGNTSVSGAGNSNAPYWSYVGAAAGSNGGFYINLDVHSPNLAAYTTVSTGLSYQNTTGIGLYAGTLKDTTAYTSFELFPQAGTMTGGTIAVYGYRKA